MEWGEENLICFKFKWIRTNGKGRKLKQFINFEWPLSVIKLKHWPLPFSDSLLAFHFDLCNQLVDELRWVRAFFLPTIDQNHRFTVHFQTNSSQRFSYLLSFYTCFFFYPLAILLEPQTAFEWFFQPDFILHSSFFVCIECWTKASKSFFPQLDRVKSIPNMAI